MTKLTPEEIEALLDTIDDLERRVFARLPKDDRLQLVWGNAFDTFAERIEIVPDAPGDIRAHGTRQDRAAMLWALRPRAILDGELIVDVVPPAEKLTVNFQACLSGMQIQIDNVLERLASQDGLDPLTVRFETRPQLRSVGSP